MKATVVRDSATKTVVDCGEGDAAVAKLKSLRDSHGAENVIVDGPEPVAAPAPKKAKAKKRKSR